MRRYKVRLNKLQQNGFEKQIVTINPMADNVLNRVKSVIKYELDIDETREPIVIHSSSGERAPSAKDAVKISDSEPSKLSRNFALNQDRTIKKEPVDNDDDPVIVHSNITKPVPTAKNTVLAIANDIRLKNSSDNVLLKVNNGKVLVQERQVPFNVKTIANRVKTSVEYQKTCGVLCSDQLQTFNGANRWNDAPRDQFIVLEPSTKRPKTQLEFYGDFKAQIQAEKTTVNKLSPSLSDVSGSGGVVVDSKKVLNLQIVNNINSSNNNIGKVQRNAAINSVKKVMALKILKLDNKKIQPVHNHSNKADRDSFEIVYEKCISNRQNQDFHPSTYYIKANNLMETTIQNTSSPLVVQPVKKVLLVQLDPKTVSKILTGSSSQVELPIVNLQHNLTFGNRFNSGSKEAHGNCAVGSARMPMNLPMPQPDVSAANRSTEEPSTVYVPKREAFPAVNAIGKSPFFFVGVDGS